MPATELIDHFFYQRAAARIFMCIQIQQVDGIRRILSSYY